jgi:hypothetical protein
VTREELALRIQEALEVGDYDHIHALCEAVLEDSPDACDEDDDE